MSTTDATTETTTSTVGEDATRTEALGERIFTSVIESMEVAAIHLGSKLGLYRALADGGPATVADLAARTGTDQRYLREWLEQQTTAGYLEVDDPAADADGRVYTLPDAHRPVLVDEDDLSFLAPFATLAVGVILPIDKIVDAFRTGAGVPYEDYGSVVVDGIARANKPMFLNLMGEWLGAVPEVERRLEADPPARVADLGAGSAWSSIAIARTFPNVTVDALDVDEASILLAKENIAAEGLSERVHPAVHDASDPKLPGTYDLITIFEALHDMNHPVEALRTARASLAEGGSVIIADEGVADRFTVPGDEIERLNYGFSVLHCLAVAKLDEDSAATGTVIRPDTVRRYATEAGFANVEVLPVDNDLWRFYRLTA